MQKAFTVSQARTKLGRLVDEAVKGKSVFLKRGKHLVRMQKVKRAVSRPLGYFKFDDELSTLANRAEPSFSPPDEN